jgi:diguanylate cyclase (GGDEF)-like protein
MMINRKPMKNIRITLVLILFSLVIILWFVNKDNQFEDKLIAQDGQIKIDEISDQTVYRLNGEWEFYPNVFLMEQTESYDVKVLYRAFEHLWINESSFENGLGYASYRLEINGLDPETDYGILLEEAGSNYQLWVNHKILLSNGTIEKNALLSKGKTYTQKNVFRSDENGNVIIVLEVSNFTRTDGGVKIAPLIGNLYEISQYYETSLMVELFVFSAMISLSMIFLMLGIIVKDIRSFYMSVLALLFSLRVVSTGNHLLYMLIPSYDLPLIWMLRLEYLSVFLMLPIFNLLTNTFEIFSFNQRYRNISYSVLVLFILFGVIVNHSGLEWMYFIFQVLIGFYGIHYLYNLFLSYRNANLDLISIIALGISFISGLVSVYYFQDVRYSFYFIIFIFTLFIATTVLHRFSIINTRTQHLENIVKIDPLTKLWNRAYLSELKFDLSKYEENDVFYTIFIDLNNFKDINDRYGHKIGDEVLRLTARRLRNNCHESDLIFRLGGDEFIIIAHMKESSAIEKVIKRLRDNFSEPFTVAEISITLSLALGYQVFDPKTDDLETIISMSDEKMYEDKRRQANR